LVWLSVHAVSLNDCHFVLVKLKELPSESSHIDNVEHVCLPWGNAELDILTLVDQSRIRNRLCSVVVVCRQIIVDQIRRLNVVHVRERQGILSINAAIVCQCCVIADNDGAAESIYRRMLDADKLRDAKVAYQGTGRQHARGTSMCRTE